jgi:ergothioneine biosynthesis protein EgtB
MPQGAPRAVETPDLTARYLAVRQQTLKLCEPLEVEDFVAQSMDDVSPAKWHIAHVTWFFETFMLRPHRPGYQAFDPAFEVLFNSYYNTVNEPFPRPRRGLLTRPTVDRVMAYRSHVDEAMLDWLIAGLDPSLYNTLELGLNHEQQHQELLLMDLKHVLFQNPLYPAYVESAEPEPGITEPLGWQSFPAGEFELGHPGEGFCFDNETPRHRVLLADHQLGDRLITNGEYLQFVRDGGYQQPLLWLSDGFSTIQREGWEHPLYWVYRDGDWFEFTLFGLKPLEPSAPVTHVSLYEADAFASWSQARLPTEAEWEHCARNALIDGNFSDTGHFHPRQPTGTRGIRQLFGEVWQWTGSAYQAYPGFQAAAGAIGEYNGKFMCNQQVLRGGCCLTPVDHMRASYRNFYYPHQRWPFTGIRLAR